MIKRFELYRYDLPETHLGSEGDQTRLRLEGVQFSDGIVVVRWLDGRALQGTSVWDSYDAFWKVHGHEEYKSEVKWLD